MTTTYRVTLDAARVVAPSVPTGIAQLLSHDGDDLVLYALGSDGALTETARQTAPDIDQVQALTDQGLVIGVALSGTGFAAESLHAVSMTSGATADYVVDPARYAAQPAIVGNRLWWAEVDRGAVATIPTRLVSSTLMLAGVNVERATNHGGFGAALDRSGAFVIGSGWAVLSLPEDSFGFEQNTAMAWNLSDPGQDRSLISSALIESSASCRPTGTGALRVIPASGDQVARRWTGVDGAGTGALDLGLDESWPAGGVQVQDSAQAHDLYIDGGVGRVLRIYRDTVAQGPPWVYGALETDGHAIPAADDIQIDTTNLDGQLVAVAPLR